MERFVCLLFMFLYTSIHNRVFFLHISIWRLHLFNKLYVQKRVHCLQFTVYDSVIVFYLCAQYYFSNFFYNINFTDFHNCGILDGFVFYQCAIVRPVYNNIKGYLLYTIWIYIFRLQIKNWPKMLYTKKTRVVRGYNIVMLS